MLSIRNLRTDLLDITELDVPAGGCVAITGPSGAGKSLLLRAIADLDTADGRISLNTTARDDMPAHIWRRKIGMVPAESGWWADDVAGHFRDPAVSGGELAALGLPGDAMAWTVSRLSTGERQRLALLRAMHNRPDALLLDEPCANLDADTTALVEAVLHQYLAQGLRLLLVTHDPSQIDRLGARHHAMAGGRLVS